MSDRLYFGNSDLRRNHWTELWDFTIESIREIFLYSPEKVAMDNIHDLHHEIFNSAPYIVGTYQCKQWLSTDTWESIQLVQTWNMEEFGSDVEVIELDPETVVNWTVYILGLEILPLVLKEFLGLNPWSNLRGKIQVY